MIRGINTSITGIAYSLRASSGGKLSLPVDPGALIYSYFKNVSGIPASDGINGVTISRLNILNILIEQMNKAGQEAAPVFSGESVIERVNAMIENYTAKLREAKASNTVVPYIPPPANPQGSIFNLSA